MNQRLKCGTKTMQQLEYISIRSCSSGQRSDTFGHYPKAEKKKSKTTDELTWNNQSSHQRIEEANYILSKLSVNPSSHKGCVMKIHEGLQLHSKGEKKQRHWLPNEQDTLIWINLLKRR